MTGKDHNSKSGRSRVKSALTPAERKKKQRECLRQEGGKQFSTLIPGRLMEPVRKTGRALGINENEALRKVFRDALDYQARLHTMAAALQRKGADRSAVERFVRMHVTPILPKLPED
jgi:hypothetical protein